MPEFPTTPEERDAQEVDPPIGLGDQGEGSNDDSDATAAPWLGALLRTVGLSIGAALLLALPLLFLPFAKRLRSRRRRAEAQPELRALGAWEEMVDRARDAGVVIPAGASRAETAAALGTKPAIWAAAQVDRAVFSAQGIDGDAAETLWQATEADSSERAAAMRRRDRFRAAYSLRSYGIAFARRHGRTEGGTA